MPDVLHAQRSLLCTATNCTPYERMFNYPRKTATGSSFPSWLQPGRRVLVKRHVRGKFDPLADDADLLEINPMYGKVRLQTGREMNVSIRDLAPLPEQTTNDIRPQATSDNTITNNVLPNNNDLSGSDVSSYEEEIRESDSTSSIETSLTNELLPAAPELHWVRRSQRTRRPVKKYGT